MGGSVHAARGSEKKGKDYTFWHCFRSSLNYNNTCTYIYIYTHIYIHIYIYTGLPSSRESDLSGGLLRCWSSVSGHCAVAIVCRLST